MKENEYKQRKKESLKARWVWESRKRSRKRPKKEDGRESKLNKGCVEGRKENKRIDR